MLELGLQIFPAIFSAITKEASSIFLRISLDISLDFQELFRNYFKSCFKGSAISLKTSSKVSLGIPWDFSKNSFGSFIGNSPGATYLVEHLKDHFSRNPCRSISGTILLEKLLEPWDAPKRNTSETNSWRNMSEGTLPKYFWRNISGRIKKEHFRKYFAGTVPELLLEECLHKYFWRNTLQGTCRRTYTEAMKTLLKKHYMSREILEDFPKKNSQGNSRRNSRLNSLRNPWWNSWKNPI